MNANELAEIIEHLENARYIGASKAATMLRQQQAEIKKWTDQYQRLNENLEMWKAGHFKQQAEIEALKAGKIRAYDNGVEDGRKPNTNNKPVAWMDEETGCFVYSQYEYEDLDEHGKDGLIPLYTHPVKELTDEEILKMAADKFHYSEYKLVIDFARAILRKAGA